jgi:putative FmdB family regulatory protein
LQEPLKSRNRGGGRIMPQYDYRCAKCKKEFTVFLSLSEKEKKKPVCTHCGSKKVRQQFTGFFAKTSRKY